MGDDAYEYEVVLEAVKKLTAPLVAAAEARGRKQAADEIAEQIELEAENANHGWYESGLLQAADFARAYAAEQDTGP